MVFHRNLLGGANGIEQQAGTAMAISGDRAQQTRSLLPMTDLRLIIAQSLDTDQQFSIRLEQRGARTIYGWLRNRNDTIAESLRELRDHYEHQLRAIRELAMAGIPVPPLDERPLLDLGRHVTALLPPAICQAIIKAARHARLRRHHLRLVLEVTSEALSLLSIPWEIIALPLGWGSQEGEGDECFLLLNADITLIRQVQGVGVNVPLTLHHPLRLQAFAATPLSVQPIDVHTTMEAIKRMQPTDQQDQHWYSGHDTLGVLLERLRASQPHIIHLVCHGEQCNTGHRVPRYDLLLTHADGYMQRVGGADLARAFTLAPSLQLVILQACYAGATTVSGSANGANNQRIAESIALTLVRSGVPTVIAMQSEVSQPTAASFVRACYTSLASGVNLEQAVAAGRLAMRAAGGIVDWSLPVVYQGNRQLRETWHTPLTSQIRKFMAARWR